ncbi:transketolase [Sphingobium sp. LB126]|uniref:transketolase n=1 Tax=Sphingobium sp. LB126 TaxID=1983755 RepID=UPI000C2099DC|nr:transketolase [Sphingobium sp. LB126]PJG47091.1 transketolase [Sphingobium sp. LB126]
MFTPDLAAPTADQADERRMAAAVRALAMDAVQQANSGHPGMPLGMADVATVLFHRFLKIDPAHPDWPDRDRFVLSAGHGSMLQYAIHYLLGYTDMPIDALRAFRQLGSTTPGHPEYGHTLGVETTTGPLGQGIATAVGMAIAQRMEAARFGEALSNHRIYVIAGDGCLQEGVSQEAIDLAGNLRLSNLVVLWDDNRISIDGATSLSSRTDQTARFRASGWQTFSIDGHDHAEIATALEAVAKAQGPVLIACSTVIGKGAPTVEGTEKAHGAPLGEAGCAAARAAMGWNHPPFEIPDEIVAAWRQIAHRGAQARRDWLTRVQASQCGGDFLAFHASPVLGGVRQALDEFRRRHRAEGTRIATRRASQLALEAINATTNQTVGGSADLTHSNLTMTSQLRAVTAVDFGGRYLHFGIREHAMAAAMNGIALHGGFIPYGGTFLSFADYARGAIRLSALMGIGVIYVMTHDSIGLGEDGPTHQPVEHLAMLRATPGLSVFRPADVIETAEAWQVALDQRDRPTVLVLSRQDLPMLRDPHAPTENAAARGAYVLREPVGWRDVTILATGSEVELAVAAAERLASEHAIAAAVVSMPCWDRFEMQDERYRADVLGTAPRVAIEAAARLGWDRWIGERGTFIGMQGFGASAPADQLYRHFGITADAVVDTAQRAVAGARIALEE